MSAFETLRERPRAEKLAVSSFLALGVGIMAIRGGLIDTTAVQDQIMPESETVLIDDTPGQN